MTEEQHTDALKHGQDSNLNPFPRPTTPMAGVSSDAVVRQLIQVCSEITCVYQAHISLEPSTAINLNSLESENIAACI